MQSLTINSLFNIIHDPEKFVFLPCFRSVFPSLRTSSVWPEELRLARSVFGEFPDRAISIFKQLSESEIAQTNRKSYEIAVGHLAELGKLMQEKGRKQEWETYISELRLSNSRKPRFLKTLRI